jgi:hypothetical protein
MMVSSFGGILGVGSSKRDGGVGRDELARFAQARGCVEQEHTGGGAVRVATDDEAVVLVPIDGSVRDADLLDPERADSLKK